MLIRAQAKQERIYRVALNVFSTTVQDGFPNLPYKELKLEKFLKL